MMLRLMFTSSGPRPLEAEDRRVELLGTHMVYREQGSGPLPVILLHGFGGWGGDWARVMKLLPGRILAPDLVGFGGSGRPRVRYSLATLHRYVLAFMDALAIDQAIVAGQSMGGSLAAWIAAHNPDRVRAVALVAPSGYPGALTYGRPLRWVFKPGRANAVARRVAESAAFERIFPRGYARQALGMTASYDASFAASIPKISQPTLILWSRGDRTVPFHHSARFTDAIAHAQLIPLDAQAGHFLNGNAPEQVAAHLARFVLAARAA
ncbi:MAG: alpha/beta hydrolase [Polyangiales bacterium]